MSAHLLTEHPGVFVQVSCLWPVRFWIVIKDGKSCDRDLSALVVPLVGRLMATGERYEPYRMLGPDEVGVEPVTAFFRDLFAAGRAEATVRSYGMDVLRWFRFLWAIDVPRNQATRIEARDFSRWLRYGRDGGAYAPSVRAHSEAVLRTFYEFHLAVGSGPVVKSVPAGSVSTGRACPRSPQSDGAVPT